MKKPALEGHEILFRYDSAFVLDVPLIEVFPRKVLGIIGPNGSGKSTLVKILSLLEKPLSGSVVIEGKAIGGGREALSVRRRFSVVFQQPLLFNRSVWENVATALKFRKESAESVRKKVDLWLRKLGIEQLAERPARTLSGGEARRVSLARSLVCDPKVFFMDEPFANLDQPTKENLMHELRSIIKESDIATLFVTHDREEAAVFSDTLSVMHEGKIVQSGTPVEIFSQPVSPFVADFVGVKNIFPAYAESNLNEQNIGLGSIRITAPTDKVGPVHVSIRPEDILLSRERVQSSARNVFRGRITHIRRRERTFYITVDIGIPLVCLVTKSSKEELGLKKNMEIWMLFKATSVHVI